MSPSPVGISDSSSIGKVKGVATILIVILVIVLVAVFFNKIMKLFSGATEALGLSDSKEGKANKELIDKKVNSAQKQTVNSPWNRAYYKNVQKKRQIVLVTLSSAQSLAKKLWDSVGYVYDSPADGSGAIHQCKNKCQVSFVSDIFYQKYGKDLLTWLNDKYDVMGQREYLREMIEYVDNLPVT